MVVADVVFLGVQAVARRLRTGRVGFEARRTIASQSEPYDAVVIGGGMFVHPGVFYLGVRAETGRVSVGPGGYVAAIKAAQLGLRVSTLLSRCASSNMVPFVYRRRASRNEVLLAELA